MNLIKSKLKKKKKRPINDYRKIIRGKIKPKPKKKKKENSEIVIWLTRTHNLIFDKKNASDSNFKVLFFIGHFIFWQKSNNKIS